MNQYLELSRGAGTTELHVEGDAAEAAFLAIKYAHVPWRRPVRRDQVYAYALPVLHFGKEVGLVTSALSDGLPDDLLCTMERGSVAVG